MLQPRSSTLLTLNSLIMLVLILGSLLWITVAVVPAVEPLGPGSAIHSSFWDEAATPASIATANGTPAEVGLRITARDRGYLVGVRFYIGENQVGPYTVNLWTDDGQKLATAESPGQANIGWHEVMFSEPVPLETGTTYIASYFSPAGISAIDEQYFANRDVMRRQGSVRTAPHRKGAPNGVHHLGSPGFPDEGEGGDNYWVDIIVVDSRAVE